jgi:hypothetical protein
MRNKILQILTVDIVKIPIKKYGKLNIWIKKNQ